MASSGEPKNIPVTPCRLGLMVFVGELKSPNWASQILNEGPSKTGSVHKTLRDF